jgi:hypothetical protein
MCGFSHAIAGRHFGSGRRKPSPIGRQAPAARTTAPPATAVSVWAMCWQPTGQSLAQDDERPKRDAPVSAVAR